MATFVKKRKGVTLYMQRNATMSHNLQSFIEECKEILYTNVLITMTFWIATQIQQTRAVSVCAWRQRGEQRGKNPRCSMLALNDQLRHNQKTSLWMFWVNVIWGFACIHFKDINAVIDWLFNWSICSYLTFDCLLGRAAVGQSGVLFLFLYWWS